MSREKSLTKPNISLLDSTQHVLITQRSKYHKQQRHGRCGGMDPLDQNRVVAWLISMLLTVAVLSTQAFGALMASHQWKAACFLRGAEGVAVAAQEVIEATTASSAAGKIVDLVLGGFEFAFKMVYNFLESERIKKFQYDAVSMWKRLNGSEAAPPVAFAPPVLGMSKNTRDLKLKENAVPKPLPRGFMIEFKAAGYTSDQFIGNSHGAFLNFMDSMIKASPILAAVVINSGIVARADEVFHAATPRSTGDEELALKHIKLLQDEAKQI